MALRDLDLDLKVTHVGRDGTAQNFRQLLNIKASMYYFHQSSGDIAF